MPMIQLTKDFSSDEMECPCCKTCNMNPAFMIMLQALRDVWNKPIHINSGYRCAKHNAAVGGVADSQHVLGRATDCGVSASDRYPFVRLAISLNFGGIGIAGNFIHIDNRDPLKAAMWKYNT